MPELSRFYGIVIKMYFDDHDPSHFHVEYAEDEAVISIETLAVIAGRLRPSFPLSPAGPDRDTCLRCAYSQNSLNSGFE